MLFMGYLGRGGKQDFITHLFNFLNISEGLCLQLSMVLIKGHLQATGWLTGDSANLKVKELNTAQVLKFVLNRGCNFIDN